MAVGPPSHRVEVEEEWWLRGGVGTHQAWHYAHQADNAVLWPAAAVACRVRASRDDSLSRALSQLEQRKEVNPVDDTSALKAMKNSTEDCYPKRMCSTYSRSAGGVKGLAFAGLPTGIDTGYNVHVNARWSLADNRRVLVWDGAASHAQQQRWNAALLMDAVPQLWTELLMDLRSSPLTRERLL